VVLGRSAGLDEDKLRHIGDQVRPEGVYGEDEWAIVEYAQRSTHLRPIDDELYGRLAAHFTTRQIMELCFTVGMSNMINRFHATFLTEVDPETNEVLAPSCPLPMAEELRRRADDGWRRSGGEAGPPGT
jgi:alkylhydroperoxidase family enzyme